MRTGRLAISRGFSAPEPHGEPARFALVPPEAIECAPELSLSDALTAVNARLAALERLGALCEAGVLTVDEFLAEKAAVLGYPASALSGSRLPDARPISFHPAERGRPRGRSLAGRLGWTLIPLGLVAGLGLSAVSQPDATASLWDEALRMIGA